MAALPEAGTFLDRFYGLIYGCVLGSAVALSCDGRDGRILRDNSENGVKVVEYPRSEGYREYQPNDWSGDVDQALLTMRAVRECISGKNFELALASSLSDWTREGLTDLGDKEPVGVDSTTFLVTAHEDFVEDPRRAVAETRGGKRAGASPMIRVIPLSAIAQPIEITINAVNTTHSHIHVTASALLQNVVLAALLKGEQPSPELVRKPTAMAMGLLSNANQKRVFREGIISTKTLEDEDIGNGQSASAIRVFMWAYRQLLRTSKHGRDPKFDSELFLSCIEEVAMCGQSAALNAAVAGAVIGVTVGISGLPPDWVEGLPNRSWLDQEIQAFLNAIGSSGT